MAETYKGKSLAVGGGGLLAVGLQPAIRHGLGDHEARMQLRSRVSAAGGERPYRVIAGTKYNIGPGIVIDSEHVALELIEKRVQDFSRDRPHRLAIFYSMM